MAKRDMIDRQILIADLMDLKVALGDVFFGAVLDRAIECVERQKAVETVEVVRCKDCKHFDMQRMECQCDAIVTDNEGGADYTVGFYLDDFCSYGERRDGHGRNEI